MKRLIVVMGLVALMVMGTTYVLAKGPGGPGPGRMADENWGCQKGVSLTPEQRTKLQELRRKLNEETAQLREAIRAKSQELRSLWTNPTADSKAIMEKEKEMRALRDQIRDKAVEMRLEARTILTPEQLEQTGKDREFIIVLDALIVLSNRSRRALVPAWAHYRSPATGRWSRHGLPRHDTRRRPVRDTDV